ncbi:MAG: hypothetical protein WC785_02880 [Tatlockia sp.]|jgi:hypothetical protein
MPGSHPTQALTQEETTQLLENKLAEAHLLEEDIQALELEESQRGTRYQLFANQLEALKKTVDLIDAAESKTQKMAITQREMHDKSLEIKQLTDTIDALLLNPKQEDARQEEARQRIQELNGLNLYCAGLEDILAQGNGEKQFYNAAGTSMHSYNEADYILSSQKELLVDANGQYYLVQSGQTLNTLTAEDKANARQQFEEAKPEIASLKVLVKSNRDAENLAFNRKRNKTFARSEALQQEILELTNQINLMQAAQASTALVMNQPNPSLSQIPTPKPTQKAGNKQPILRQSYRQILGLMRTNPTAEGIKRFKKGYQEEAHPQIDNTIKAGYPITKEQMKRLLKNIERFGVSAYGPTVRKMRRPRPTPLSTDPFD